MLESLLIKLQALRHGTLLKKTPTQVFFCEICGIFKNTFSYRTSPVATSRNGKAFHRLSIFITMTELNAMCLFNIHILVLLFNLHTESKILTFINTNGKPDMLTEKYSMKNSYNKNILLERKIYIYMIKIFLLHTNLFWLNENIFFDIMRKKVI